MPPTPRSAGPSGVRRRNAKPKPGIRPQTATPSLRSIVMAKNSVPVQRSSTPAPAPTAKPKSPLDLLGEVFKPRFGR
jgi:hypothetical protein